MRLACRRRGRGRCRRDSAPRPARFSGFGAPRSPDPRAGQSQAACSAVRGRRAPSPRCCAPRLQSSPGALVPVPGPAQGGPRALYAASPGAAEPAGWLLRWRRKGRLRREVRLRAGGPRWVNGAGRAGASLAALGASGGRRDARCWAQFAEGSSRPGITSDWLQDQGRPLGTQVLRGVPRVLPGRGRWGVPGVAAGLGVTRSLPSWPWLDLLAKVTWRGTLCWSPSADHRDPTSSSAGTAAGTS